MQRLIEERLKSFLLSANDHQRDEDIHTVIQSYTRSIAVIALEDITLLLSSHAEDQERMKKTYLKG